MKYKYGILSFFIIAAVVIWVAADAHLEICRYHQVPHDFRASDSTCILTGHIEGYKMNAIGLTYMSEKGLKHINIDHHHGDFAVKLKVSEPGYAFISYNQYNWLPKYGRHSNCRIVIQPGDVIYVEGKADSLEVLNISGSPLTAQLDSIDKTVLSGFQKEYQMAFESTRIRHKEEWDSIWLIPDKAKQDEKWQDFSDKYGLDKLTDELSFLDYIKSHPHSIISALELSRLSGNLNIEEYKSAYESLDSNIKRLSYAKTFKKRIDALANTQIGMQAPDLSLPDINGHRVKLSEMKGKVVLVYSWVTDKNSYHNGRSPEDLQKVYNQFHPKGFEIYAISTNQTKEKWQKTIVKDSMAWINVIDTNQSQNHLIFNKYGQSADQSTILIGPDGKVLDRNIRATMLKEKLAQLLP
jgi:peroxiredoxin